MSVRGLEHLTNGATVAITLILGSACKGSEEPSCSVAWCFAALPSGAKVIPKPAPADTFARASVSLEASVAGASLAYTYSIAVAPSGTIDSIALYQAGSQDPLPASATAILCAGVAACAATSGMGTVVPPATLASVITYLRAYGMQLVFFTTRAQYVAGGAMRATPYPVEF